MMKSLFVFVFAFYTAVVGAAELPSELLGMKIDMALFHGNGGLLKTPGATFDINLSNATIKVTQRLEKERPLTTLKLPEDWMKKLERPARRGIDCVWMMKELKRPGLIVSGDSTIRLFGITNFSVRTCFEPAHTNTYPANDGMSLLDEWGGVCIAPPKGSSNLWSTAESNGVWIMTSSYHLPMVFVGVCPPRPFDEEKSLTPVVHYSSHVERYPSDEQIEEFSKFAKVLELHSWIWKNRWNPERADDENNKPAPKWWDYSWVAPDYRWVPDNADELKRVVATAHKFGMKVAPYVSFDLSQTPGRRRLFHWQLMEIDRIYAEYDFDGFFIDGLYPEQPEPSYTVIRCIRQTVGDEGWLSLRDDGTSFPFIDAYADLVLTSGYNRFDRWRSTAWRISNAAAAVWPELPVDLEDGTEYLENLMNAGAEQHNRMIYMVGPEGQWRGMRLKFTESELNAVKKFHGGADRVP